MNKRFSYLIVALLCLLGGQSAWAQQFAVGDLSYSVIDAEAKTVSVRATSNSISGDVTVPAKVTDPGSGVVYTVTTLGSSAFSGCSAMTSISLPSTLTTIEGYAFYRCSSIKDFTMPASVTSIGDWAFEYGPVYDSFTIEEAESTLGNLPTIKTKKAIVNRQITNNFSSDLESVTIGGNVTSIPDNFANGSKLTEVNIGGKVKTIGYAAFKDCKGLLTATIGEGVTTLGSSAFSGCSAMTSISLPSTLTTIEGYAFYSCSSIKDFTMPGSVTSIGDWAFYNGPVYDSFTIEEAESTLEGLPTIKTKKAIVNRQITNSFSADLESLTIGGSMTSIPDNFANGSQLTEVNIGGKVKTIGYAAFKDCKSLLTATIGEGVTTLGSSAFQGCSAMTSISLPSTLTTIDSYAFNSCSSIKDFTMPASVTYIGDWAFYNGPVYDSFTIEEAESTLEGLPTIKTKKAIVNRQITNNFSGDLESLTIGGNVTSIPDNFAEGSKLTEVNIGGKVKTIGYAAFKNCKSLLTATIGEGVTTLGSSAFQGCSAMTSISLPSTLTTIGGYAFYSCGSLKDFTMPASVTSIGDEAFREGPVYDSFTIEEAETTLENLPTIKTKKAIVNRQITNSFSADLESLTIGGNVTYIPDNFAEGSKLTEVNIGGKVKTIGYAAFKNCKSLLTATIGEGVTTIGSNAFYYCEKMTSISLPSTLTTIDSYALAGCSSLKDFTMPGSVTSIGDWAFYYGPVYDSFTIEEAETTLENLPTISTKKAVIMRSITNGFSNDLESLTIGGALTSIPENYMSGKTNLTEVTIEPTVTAIGDNAFSGCTNIANMHVSWEAPLSINANVIPTVSNEATLWVPAGKKRVYAAAEGWSKFTKIQPTHYIVTLATEGNGTVTLDGKTEGDVLVPYNATDIEFTLAAGEDYDFTSLNNGTADVYTNTSDGATKQGGVYAMPSIDDDMTITATFTIKPLMAINATATGGTATASADQVYRDRDAYVTFAANEGHELTSVKLNDVEVIGQVSGNKLTLTNIQANQNVVATFTLIHYAVSTAATTNGTITLASTDVQWGNGTTATITPATGYDIDHVTINGVNADANLSDNTLTISNVKANTTVGATFKKHAYTISKAATENGTITLAATSVLYQDGTTATITPATGYDIDHVTINGENADAKLSGNTLTISNVSKDLTVAATFKKHAYTISKAATTNGTIELASTSVLYQESTTATLTPAAGYMIEHAFLNGVNADDKLSGNILTIDNVSADTKVSATFRILSYRVSITGEGVTVDNEYPQHGESVTITVAEDSDRELTSLMVDGVEKKGAMSGNTYTINNVTANVTVVATFKSTVERITITNACAKTTFCCNQDLDFTGSEMRAYIAVGFNKKTGAILMARVYDVPAGTGVLLVAEKDVEYKIPYAESQNYYKNLFVCNLSGEKIYIAPTVDVNGTIMRNWYLSGSNGTFKTPASSTGMGDKKAYLQIPEAWYHPSNDAKLEIVFEDELVDGIEEFEMFDKRNSDSRIFNLNGIQLNKAGKGINIINGKKVLNK